ncbi:50S ribosome-binding GTPase [Candidatus Woesearchaeota archaeon]|nr:50S ribosome-binding GTPase [Candidatus Woesearchaeota archaeon]
MPSFWRVVNSVLQEADIIIEVLDARFPQESRNVEIEEKIRHSGKIILYVITKSDLVDRPKLEEAKKELEHAVYISSLEKLGTTKLKKKILELSRGHRVVVGVVGYPNVGKSSLINALAGRHAARTSSESGFTKGLQKIKVDNKIMLLDTPGVFPETEKGSNVVQNTEYKHALFGAIDYAKVKDPEQAALGLIERERATICKVYNLSKDCLTLPADDVLEILALRLGRLSKGGKGDLEAVSRQILKDWQTGKIKRLNV